MDISLHVGMYIYIVIIYFFQNGLSFDFGEEYIHVPWDSGTVVRVLM